MMLHRRKKLRTNMIKEMKIIYGEMLLKVRKCVPEKFFRRLKMGIRWMIIVDKAGSEGQPQ